ncbi:MAG: hypothetical protein LBU62_11000 [Bacteroidales bacterium]|nr:hypothetical protein [Bacteroidales bacterium]
MKKIVLMFVFVLSIVQIYSRNEEQEILAKFIITDATDNGIDVTPEIVKNQVYTVFYTSGNDEFVYMANVAKVPNTQSFGPMYSVDSETYPETDDRYRMDVFDFNWHYSNTYDTKKGTAKVKVTKIYKPQGVAFTLKIITESLDIVIYRGYMEGTINFNEFNK